MKLIFEAEKEVISSKLQKISGSLALLTFQIHNVQPEAEPVLRDTA